MDAEKMAARFARKPQFKDRDRDLGISGIRNKRLEQLKEKVQNHVQNAHRRNQWLEATKRKNYIQEYDRLHGALSVLNKDRNAIGIQNLRDRMSHLRDLAHASMEGASHEIYSHGEKEIRGTSARHHSSR